MPSDAFPFDFDDILDDDGLDFGVKQLGGFVPFHDQHEPISPHFLDVLPPGSEDSWDGPGPCLTGSPLTGKHESLSSCSYQPFRCEAYLSLSISLLCCQCTGE